MDIHQKDRRRLLNDLYAVEVKFPLHFIGLLLRGAAAHIFDDSAIALLAEKRPGLSLTGLTGAELELSKRLDRPAGIVLTSELRGREREEILSQVEPL
jgi:predicted nucleotidyltransferase